MKPFDKALLYAVRYGLFAVFALPFVVWLNHLYPWVTGKVFSFEILVEVLFPVYVLLALRRREFRPSKNPFLYALLAYFAVATLAMLFGDNLSRSLWSKPDRLTGMFFQYHLLAFFLMAGAVWREVLAQPIVAAIATASVLSLQALHQVAAPAAGSDGRGSATLGNPDYLGQYLVPHLFLAGWLVRRHWKSSLRWLWCAAGLLILAGIVSAQSKGAVVGVFVGTLFAALILAFRAQGKGKKIGMAGLALVALAVVGYFAGQKIGPVNRWLYDHRFSIQYLQETTGSRTLLLKNAVKGISQRPLLGWGPENFEDGYYLNYDPHTLRFSEYETRQDRPHNLVLEMLHNLGALGLLAYLAMLFCAMRSALRKGRAEWLSGAALFVAAISQVATNLFIFETPMSYMALFFMLALIAADAGRTDPAASGPDESSIAAVPIFLLAAAVSFWCLYGVVVGTIGATRITAEMIVTLQQSSADAAQWEAQWNELRALRTPYYERHVRALVSHLSRARGEYLEGPFKPILIKMTEEEHRLLQHNRTDFVQALVTTVSYLSFHPRTSVQQQALEDDARLMSQLSPNRQEVETILAQIAWEKGDLSGAEAHIKRIKTLDPEEPIGDAWEIRWQLEFGDPSEAARLVADHPEVKKDSDAWGQVEYGTLHLLNQKRWKDLRALQQASVRFGTRNIQWDLTGAVAEWALGEKAKSDALLAEARTLYPDKADLIATIEAGRAQISANGE